MRLSSRLQMVREDANVFICEFAGRVCGSSDAASGLGLFGAEVQAQTCEGPDLCWQGRLWKPPPTS